MWFLSPSGWPTWADDDSDHELDLEERGYAPIDADQVADAVAAYQAGSPGPVPQDPLSSQELVTAIGTPTDPVAVALRAAFAARAGRVYLDDFFGPTRVPGTTDDTAAWTAAVAAAAGKTLIVGANRIKLSDVVEFTADDVTVDATGAVFNLIDDGTAEGRIIRAIDCGNFRWIGGKITQTAAARTGVYGLLTLVRVEDATIDGLFTEGGSSTGLYIEGGSGLRVVRLTARNPKADGIHISRGTADSFIDSPIIVGAGDDSVALVGVLSDGATTYEPVRRVQILNPTVSGMTTLGAGVALIGVVDCNLIGGVIDGSPTSCVRVQPDVPANASTTNTNNGIYGTTVRGATQAGFVFGEVEDCILDGARAFDCDTGISFIGSTRTLISGGKFRGNAFGVYEPSGTGNRVHDADLRGNSGAASNVVSAVLTDCITS